MLRIKFGKKEEDDEADKKEDDGEKKAKHSIDGILGDKGRVSWGLQFLRAFSHKLVPWRDIAALQSI